MRRLCFPLPYLIVAALGLELMNRASYLHVESLDEVVLHGMILGNWLDEKDLGKCKAWKQA